MTSLSYPGLVWLPAMGLGKSLWIPGWKRSHDKGLLKVMESDHGRITLPKIEQQDFVRIKILCAGKEENWRSLISYFTTEETHGCVISVAGTQLGPTLGV